MSKVLYWTFRYTIIPACHGARSLSEPPGLHPGTLPLPQFWQPVKEEINNKVNKVKVANCVNEGYEFPVEEVDDENMVWNEDKEVLTKKQ